MHVFNVDSVSLDIRAFLLDFDFCLPLIPLGASREETFVCCTPEIPGQEGCCTKIVSL